MARLTPSPFIPPPINFDKPDIREELDAAWKAVEQQGDLLTFPVCDGQAVYIVRSIHPPLLQAVDWLDCYRADPALIRGLRAIDIETRLAQRKAIAALFGRKCQA